MAGHYLMHSFVMTLKWLSWEKEIVRGASVQRQRYVVESDTCWICACRTDAGA